MSRSLRARTSINYADMFQQEDGDDETPAPYEFDADTGSEFELAVQKDGGNEGDEEEDGYDAMDDVSDDAPLDSEDIFEPIEFSTSKISNKSSKKPTTTTNTSKSNAGRTSLIKPVGASLPRSSKRQIANHRHRAVPLFSKNNIKIERITEKPKLFRPYASIPTNNFTANTKIVDRLSKAWAFNVGPGPIWELVEDRAWFKESRGPDSTNFLSDANARPLVYPNIRCRGQLQPLNPEDAAPYLPREASNDEGAFRPPAPVPCSFGPINKQDRRDMIMLESFPLSEYLPELHHTHVFNPGAPVWGLDWCPIHPSEQPKRLFKQYLAVGPLTSSNQAPEIGVRVNRPTRACIQIWSLSRSQSAFPSSSVAENQSPDSSRMKCELVLCHEAGPAMELKWCPLPCHDRIDQTAEGRIRKLGLLGGTFQDGSFCVFVVPEPEDVRQPEHDITQPIYLKLSEPILRIQLDETECFAFDWGNSEIICIGTTHGTLAIYHLGATFNGLDDDDVTTVIDDLLPTHYLNVHQAAIRAVTWIRAPPSGPDGSSRFDRDPTVVCTGGYDGMACITDIREGHGSVINRTRDVINAMIYGPYVSGPITIDHENIVKAYSASPSMLGRGHLLLEPQGPIWSIHASDYHPQIAVGSADGSCYTSNSLRSTRRGGSVAEYRMLDRFLPQETPDRPTASKQTKKSQNTQVEVVSTGVWSQEVGIQRVVWNQGNGPVHSIDALWGRFLGDRIPYNDVESMREDGAVGDYGCGFWV
ncbi:hypothetical protein DL96DRAFT_1669346 [Flagelloscypha sp. PMI_526]|nr:hypothetical protein DL96DRAFT_1669346 [Flagelloscypha sp. PMI_526]